jgi:hypothetical protein
MYIFLDVDGVLNTKADWRRRAYSLNAKCVEEFCGFLKKLDTPKIVLSSTWRKGIAGDGTTAAHMEELMQALSQVGITEIDRTAEAPDGSRSKEINHYLRRHPAEPYIILDDDPELFEQREKTPYLYLTNPETGFTRRDAAKLRKMTI